MFKRFSLSLLIIALWAGSMSAQTEVDPAALKAQKAEKEGQIAALQGEVAGIQAQLDALPGWRFGSLGTIGLNFASFSDWLARETPNTFSSTIGFSGNAYANLIQEKFFWRNSGNINLAWTKLNVDTETFDNDSLDYENTADAINISSLYGYRFNDQWAASALGEYRSTIASNFNNPGFLDIGVGATWTPINDLVVVFHPLNYNFVFADDDLTFESSLGCKIVADYAKSLPKGINWRTNLSAFVSYSDPSNFSNWTWVNSFGFTMFKGIGVGLEFGLRGNKQEGYNAALAADETLSTDTFKIDDLDSDDNPLQTYWLLGFTYSL
ncbi:MAG: DUF3078 domain-containing protein [Bacteroidota bacterium]